MSQRLTLGTVKPIVARVLRMTQSDSRVSDYVNRAVERLLYSGKSVGTTARYRVCVSESCLTWPREIETIEAWAWCNSPGIVRGGWYEFMDSGPGVLEEDDCNGNTLIDRGEACSYDDPVGGSDKVFRIWARSTETTTDPFIVQHYDSNGNWVRTQHDGEWIDGEAITIPTTAGTYAVGTKSIAKAGLVRIIKPRTNDIIHLYEYDTTDLTMLQLGQYQPSEEIPIYRRSLIPGLINVTTGDDCESQSVTVVAKLRHVPAYSDNDFLVINHADAIREECMAIYFSENNDRQNALLAHAEAMRLLNDQVKHHNGAGEVQAMRLPDSTIFGAGFGNLQ